MKPKIILAAILILLDCQAFSQQITIKGRLIDYETGDPIHFANVVSVISDNDGTVKNESGTVSDTEGKFEFTGKPGWIEISYPFVYRIKIINIPEEIKEIDFGDILLAKGPITSLTLNSDEYDQEELKELNRTLKENILEDSYINISGNKCKPYFENQWLVFDCAEIQEY